MNTPIRRVTCLVLLLAVSLLGCKSLGPNHTKKTDNQSPTAKAEALFDQGDYEGALCECVDLYRQDPMTPGLNDLKELVLKRLERQRRTQAERHAEIGADRMLTDYEGTKTVPDTYGLRRSFTNAPTGFATPSTAIQKALQQKVAIHLTDASLQVVIDKMYENWKLPIVADADLAVSNTFRIDSDSATIKEILDYVGHNLGVTFYAGRDLIWVTKSDKTEPTVPLETRLYRLRKGDPNIKFGKTSSTTTADLSPPEEYARLTSVSNAIARFVPTVPGSDFMFDQNVHLIIARNTVENLSRIEGILDAMDVTPPQVLIEARFVSVKVEDTKEVGIDWLLNSGVALSTKGIRWDGTPYNASESEISRGASVGYLPFENAGQGLNLSYQGILTDPQFKAVLHALDLSGKSRVLSVPRITTLNNQEAQIHVGEKYLYYKRFKSESVVAGYDSNGREILTSVTIPDGDPDEEPLGITLVVTPSLGADQRAITLALFPTRTDLEGWNIYGGSGGSISGGVSSTSGNVSSNSSLDMIKLPIFRESMVRTKLVVDSGETVVLGGLVSGTESDKISGIPLLSSIPFLGQLFSYRSKVDDKENLLIFVTARVISPRGEDLIPLPEPKSTEDATPKPEPSAPPSTGTTPGNTP